MAGWLGGWEVGRLGGWAAGWLGGWSPPPPPPAPSPPLTGTRPKTPRKTPKKHIKKLKTPKKTHVIKREHDDEMFDEGVVDRKRFRAGDTTVANLLARLQSDGAPQTGPLASCTKCSHVSSHLGCL